MCNCPGFGRGGCPPKVAWRKPIESSPLITYFSWIILVWLLLTVDPVMEYRYNVYPSELGENTPTILVLPHGPIHFYRV